MVNDAEATVVVRIDVDPRGGWQVRRPGVRPTRYATREEAERAVRLACAGDRRASQLLVRDAYGRVMDCRMVGRAAEN
jgi:hypothetical protein